MNQVQLLSLLCLTGAAAIFDARTQRIPNRLIVVGLVLALGVRLGLAVAVADLGNPRELAAALLDAMGSALLGLVGCALLPLSLFRVGAMGGGDVKLLGVAGALVALGPGLELTRAALVIAVLFGFGRLALVGQLRRSLRSMGQLVLRIFGVRKAAPVEPSSLTPLPFGPHVFIAACYLALTSWAPANAAASAEPPSSGALSVGD